MKRLNCFILSFVLVVLASPSMFASTDIKDILGGLGGSSSGSDIGSTIGSVLNGVLSSSKLSVSDIKGTWSYVEPAVEFKSENLLKKAGGAAAASTIKSKLSPYYEKAGVQNLKFTVNDDKTFTLSINKVNLSGTIEEGEADGQFVFSFKAAGKISLGKITAYMSKNISGQLTLTFDASKLITLVNAVAKISSSLQTVANLLNSYDGLTVGFVLKKS